MLRSHTCAEIRIADVHKEVILCGWVQRSRDKGSMIWVDLRDRYGITQLFFNEHMNTLLESKPLGREFVLQIKGSVLERSNKNAHLPTGDIEIEVSEYTILNASETPPFTIEDNTDGGDDLRMKYRYLDLRRNTVRKNLELRHQVSRETRNYLDAQQFIEVETPVLIKSTPALSALSAALTQLSSSIGLSKA